MEEIEGNENVLADVMDITIDSHIDYLKKHGMLWEKQALLKASHIA